MELQNPVQPPVPGAPRQKTDIKVLAKTYLEKGKNFFVLARSRLSEDPSMKRMLMLAGGAFGVIFFLIIAAALAQRVIKMKGAVPASPTPAPQFTGTPEPTVFNPSRYATDSAILSLEESVKGINRDAESLDIREYNLKPPALDFDINFQATQ